MVALMPPLMILMMVASASGFLPTTLPRTPHPVHATRNDRATAHMRSKRRPSVLPVATKDGALVGAIVPSSRPTPRNQVRRFLSRTADCIRAVVQRGAAELRSVVTQRVVGRSAAVLRAGDCTPKGRCQSERGVAGSSGGAGQSA